MTNIPVFFIEPTGRTRISLRRYRSTRNEDAKKCPLPHGYHNKLVFITEAPERKSPEGWIEEVSVDVYQDDSRWPAKCDCGYEFNPNDEADKDQVSQDSIYRRTDNGQEMTLQEAGVGAIWNAWWMVERGSKTVGADGMCLVCKMPGGHDWMIDGVASNCDSPCKYCGIPRHAHPEGNKSGHHYEDAHPHNCWIRHGTPPNLTVDKNGVTCGAGAGSIVVPGWHGFLTNGKLVSC